MKKLLVKSEFIIQEYKAPIEGVEAQPEKWVKGEEVLFEAPLDLTDYIYHPAIEGVEAVAEVPELKELRVIDQTQGEDAELELWLSGNLAVGKYPEGYVVEYINLEQDYDYKLAKCIEARVSEYPSFGDFLNAYFDGGSPALDELREKRLEIKAKYPKPEQA